MLRDDDSSADCFFSKTAKEVKLVSAGVRRLLQIFDPINNLTAISKAKVFCLLSSVTGICTCTNLPLNNNKQIYYQSNIAIGYTVK